MGHGGYCLSGRRLLPLLYFDRLDRTGGGSATHCRAFSRRRTAFPSERKVRERPKPGQWTGELDRRMPANAKVSERGRPTPFSRTRGRLAEGQESRSECDEHPQRVVAALATIARDRELLRRALLVIFRERSPARRLEAASLVRLRRDCHRNRRGPFSWRKIGGKKTEEPCPQVR